MDGTARQHPLTVLITATTWWPLSARLAIRFIQHGCSVAALCPNGHMLMHVSGLRSLYRYRPLDAGQSLARAIADLHPDLVVPCDDRAVWQLHEAYERYPGFRPLIEASLGEASAYESIRSRVELMRIARALGLRSPDTCAIASTGDFAAWTITPSRPAVVKLDGTWGGAGVRIVRSADEAEESIGALLKPLRHGTAWKRYLVNGDPLAFWARKSGAGPVVSLQRFIPGRPANAMLACWQGELLGLVAVEVIASQGATGAATIVRLIDHPEITEAARRLTARLGLSGFHGLDFMLEDGTDFPFLIELNPRCTQLGHLILPGQGDLAGLLCGALHQTKPLAERAIEGDVVAFFPQAAAWNPESPHLQLIQYDVPWSEPALVQELLRHSWSDRRYAMRLYRLLRGHHPEPVPDLDQLSRATGLTLRAAGSVARRRTLPRHRKRHRLEVFTLARTDTAAQPEQIAESQESA